MPSSAVVYSTNKISSTIIVRVTIALSKIAWIGGRAATPIIIYWITETFTAIQATIPGSAVVTSTNKVS